MLMSSWICLYWHGTVFICYEVFLISIQTKRVCFHPKRFSPQRMLQCETVTVCWLCQYIYCHFVPLVFCDCVTICSESSSLITNLVDWFAYADFGWHPLPLLAYSHQHGSGIKMSWCILLCIMLILVPEYLR